MSAHAHNSVVCFVISEPGMCFLSMSAISEPLSWLTHKMPLQRKTKKAL